jgi:hypothetical protein
MITTETSKDITINGVKVTCYSDGSLEVDSPMSNGRRFGSKNSDGYMIQGVNGQTVQSPRSDRKSLPRE